MAKGTAKTAVGHYGTFHLMIALIRNEVAGRYYGD